MKKRFFNALILGAVLLSTGAVTSCKDYDDDINNLQSQIDGLSKLETLKTDVATLSSAVSAAQSDATKALADAAKAQGVADKAATKEELAALQTAVDAAKTAAKQAQDNLDAAKAELEALIAQKADKSALNEAKAALETLIADKASKQELADAQAALEALIANKADKEDVNAALAKIAEAKLSIEENKAAIALAQAAADAAKAAADAAGDAAGAAQADATKALADAAKAIADAKAAADKAQEAADGLKGKADKTVVSGLTDRIYDLEQALEALQKAGITNLTSDIVNALIGTTETGSLAERVETLEGLINSSTGDVDLTSLAAQLGSLQNEAKALNIAFSTMITDIQLFHINGAGLNYDHRMNFLQTTEVATYAWYKDLDEKENTKLNIKNKKMETLKLMPEEVFNFVKDSRYVGEDEIIVRVSPVDANLSQRVDDIMFLDSKGREISDVVKVESVKKFDGLLTTSTRAAGNETGLWVIKVKPVTTTDEAGKVTLDEDRFNEAAIDKSKGYKTSILYSVAIKDNSYAASTEEDAETVRRCVTSEYDLTLFTAKAERCYDFNVLTKKNAEETNNKGISVNRIHNRYWECEDGTPTGECKELSWLNSSKPSSEVILEGADANAVNRRDDNRQNRPILAVEKDEPITIDFTVAGNPAKQIKGFFVTLDEEYALESHPSEINAWRSYNYTGVGYTANDGTKHPATLHEGNKGIISVNLGNTNVLGDVIGFRVYAVNLDGTLTDPDGRAFYVAVGDVMKEGLKLSADVKYVKVGNDQYFISDKVAVSDEIKNALADLTIDNMSAWKDIQEDAAEEKHAFEVLWFDADDNLIGKIDNLGNVDGNIVNALNEDEVAYVKFKFQNPDEFIDDATYTQSVILQKKLSQGVSATWSDVAKIEFSATKVMPTGVSYGFMSGQNMYQMVTPLDVNGNPDNYRVIDGYKKGGRVDFNNVFVSEENKNNSGLQGLGSIVGRYEFTIADGTYKNNNGRKPANLTFSADGPWDQPQNIYIATVNNGGYNDVKSLIDSKTKRDIDAKFVYQDISKTYDVNTSRYIPNHYYKADAKFVVAANESDDNAKTEQIVYCSWTKDFACKIGNDDKWVKGKKNVVTWTESANKTTTLNLNNVEITYDEKRVVSSLKDFISDNLGDNISGAYHSLRILENSESNNSVVSTIPGRGYTKGSRGEYNPYFTVEFVDTEEEGVDVIFTQNNQTTQRPANGDAETLCFTVEDCFGNQFEIALPIKVVTE